MVEEELEKLIRDNCFSSNKWDTYKYNNIPVPRVSEILSTMLHEEFLLSWANSLGFKRQSYTKVRDFAAKKGTASHNLIEEFLNTGTVKEDFSDIDDDIRSSVYNAYNSFISWYFMIKENHEIEILDIEKTLVCPYCGGTLDILAKIDGKTYIIDLKTSNHMTYKYFIQLSAYTYMSQNYYNIPIDGVCILWLDKSQIRYRDYVLDSEVVEHNNMINQGINTFISLLYAYYNRYLLEEQYKTIFKGSLV